MNDCPNADVRDLLPDLLHGRLDAGPRALVEAHLAGCDDCQAELALLRDLRGSLARTPRLDLAAIVAAVPGYRTPARRSWVGWRTAAAITMFVAGGSSIVLIQRNVAPHVDTLTVAPVPASAVADPVTAPVDVPSGGSGSAPRETAVLAKPAPDVSRSTGAAAQGAQGARAAVSTGGELAIGGASLGNLSDRELATFLENMGSLSTVPSVEVDNTALAPIAPTSLRRVAP